MAASAVVGVVGTAPISFTDSAGAQKSVPLSALQFSGSALQLTPDWVTVLNPPDAKTLLAVATARLAAGELTPPPVRPPSPAIAVTATHPGPESNNITVGVTVTPPPDPGPGPGQLLNSTTVKFTATETDTYTGLSTAAIGETIGVDIPSGSQPAGTGLVVVKSGSIATSDALPVDQQHVFTSAGFDVKAASSSILFTLVPRADPTGLGGLSVHVTPDPSGTTFTVTATYDSSGGTQPEVTILTLNALPPQVAYLVTAGAPPGGAMLPPPTPQPIKLQLSGGGPGVAASGLFYTA